MIDIPREEVEELQGLIKDKRNGFYQDLVLKLDRVNTLEDMKNLLINYIETYKIED